MLIITEQRKIGAIFGHAVYQVTKTAMIELSNSKMKPTLLNSNDENRYVCIPYINDVPDFTSVHKI